MKNLNSLAKKFKQKGYHCEEEVMPARKGCEMYANPKITRYRISAELLRKPMSETGNKGNYLEYVQHLCFRKEAFEVDTLNDQLTDRKEADYLLRKLPNLSRMNTDGSEYANIYKALNSCGLAVNDVS